MLGRGRLDAVLSLRVLIAFGVSALFFLGLFLPRASDSRFLPVPLTNRRELGRIDRVELARFPLAAGGGSGPGAASAQGASGPELSVGVRTVGELFRRAGGLLAAGSPEARVALGELRRQFRLEVERGSTTELLALRSLQSQLFVRALTGQSERRRQELDELGGDFARLVEQGWLGQERAAVSPAMLRLLFRVRWGHLVGCHREGPFGPSLEELRAYYSTYLLHPPGDLADEGARALERVRYVQALARVDREFPSELATGVLLLKARQHELARQALSAHLEQRPAGAFHNLARNYLLFAASGP